MCGIIAILSLEGRPVCERALALGLAALHHRGPDGRRTWLSPDGRVGLGHARLSVIDLATGDQPIANEDESAWIAKNGEFYDYERVRDELVRAGHRLRTRSDSEIALHLYEDLGREFVHSLRGEYAFVIWDERAQTLTAVRDRFGIKPLFYAVHDGALYLASEIKALFAAGVPARWDPQGLYASLGFRLPGQTQFEGVKALPPGHYLAAHHSDIALTPYWDLACPRLGDEEPVRSDAEWIEAFRTAFEEAVRLRLRADVPVGCYLSGGVDSSAVLGLTARHSSAPVRAFTLSFDDPEYDEAHIARDMADKAGADWLAVPVDAAALAEHFSDAVYHGESHAINAHFVAKYLLSRAVRETGLKVVLTGEGADELLAGYPHFREDGLRTNGSGRPAPEIDRRIAELEADHRASSGILLPGGPGEFEAPGNGVLDFLPTMFQPSMARLKRLAPLLDQEFFATIRHRDHLDALLAREDVVRGLSGRAPLNQSLYLWARTSLPSYILALLGDRMEMAHSIEGRLPFLDHRLAELLVQAPVELKLRGRTDKYLLREATRDVITETVYRRPKHPFLSPAHSADGQGPMAALIQDTLHSDVVRDVPFLDGPAVRGLADRVAGMTAEQRLAVDPDLVMLSSLVVLHQRLVRHSTSEPSTWRP